MIGIMAGTLARIVQDFVQQGTRRDALVAIQAVTPTT